MSQADNPHTTSLLSRRAAMASTVAAFSLLPGAAKAASLAGNPDAELFKLVADFEAAMKATDEAWAAADMDDSVPNDIAIAAEEHAGDVQGEIYEVLDQIVDFRATTPEGIKAKAWATHRYLSWPALHLYEDEHDPEARLAISLVRDMVASAST